MKFSVGQRLREARLSQGLDLETLVARTKIAEKFLNAIEADDRKAFPSGFFYKSFVDQYARALGVDTREIDEEISAILSAEAPLPLPGEGDMPVRRITPLVYTPRSDRRRVYASIATFVLVLAGCSGFYAWWRNVKARVPAPPPVKTEVASKNVQVSVTPSVPAPTSVPVAQKEPSAPPAPASPATPPEPAAVPVSLTTSQPDDRQPTPRLLLELVARHQTWLSISSDGLMVFKGTLGANESKTVEGKAFAKLRVNDPAALEVKLNGKVLGPLGPPGQFLVVVFTRDKVHVLDSAKESDD